MSFTSSRLVAQQLGQELMEECIAAKYDQVVTLARSDIFEMKETVRGTEKLAKYNFVVGVTDQGTETRLVTVDVNWESSIGSNNKVSYRTLLTRDG